MSDHPTSRQWFEIAGTGHSIGNINQSITYGGSEDRPKGTYTRTPLAVTPLTSNRLAVVSVVFGGLALIPAFAAFEPFKSFFRDPDVSRLASSSFLGPLFLVSAATLCCIGFWRAARFVRYGLQRFSPRWWLPAVASIDGRLALARYSGTCPLCENKLRFLNKATRHAPTTGMFGQLNQKVVERQLRMECVANPRQHWWNVDPAAVWPDTPQEVSSP